MRSTLRDALPKCALLLTICFAMASACPAFGKEPHLEFVRGLCGRGYFDIAYEYLERLRSSPDIDEETKSRVPLEVCRVMFAEARAAVSADRLDLLERAFRQVHGFLERNPTHVQADEARILGGYVAVETAQAFLKAARQHENNAERHESLDKAATKFKTARAMLDRAEKDCRTKLSAFPPFVPKNQPELRKQKNAARRTYVEAAMALGTCLYQHAQLDRHAEGERARLLTDAAEAFSRVRQQFRVLTISIHAALWEGRCYQELGQILRATPIFEAILDTEPSTPEVSQLQAQALHAAMECWLDPKHKRLDRALDRAEAWLRTAGPQQRSSSEGARIAQLLDQVKRELGFHGSEAGSKR